MLKINGYAKVNLSLDVLGKREDGYHDLQMIMQTLELHDEIILERISSGIQIECNAMYVPNNSCNIAYKAAELMFKQYELAGGIRIAIKKNIPVAAGLAGGSTDAAAVIKGINSMFNLNKSQEELMILGKCIGADVPYCIMGGTALAEGIGEKLTKLNPLNNIPVVLVKPPIGVSTAWVYGNLNASEIVDRPETSKLIEAVNTQDIKYICNNMINVLESVTIRRYSIINNIKQMLIKLGASGSMMSGSGPTVFGIFESQHKAESAYKRLKHSKHECILTKMYSYTDAI